MRGAEHSGDGGSRTLRGCDGADAVRIVYGEVRVRGISLDEPRGADGAAREAEGDDRTLIFYEAPHKLCGTLDDLLAAFGDRKISLCRELTKLNEEITRTTLSGAVRLYSEREPRGEYVLIVDGQSELEAAEDAFWHDMTVEEHIQHYIDEGKSRMDAMKACAKDRGMSKSEVYGMVNKGKKEK